MEERILTANIISQFKEHLILEERSGNTIVIYAEMERKEHHCSCCGTATTTVHDYRKQNDTDII